MIANHEIIESAKSEFSSRVLHPGLVSGSGVFGDCGDALNNATSEPVMSELFYSSHSYVMSSVSKCKYMNAYPKHNVMGVTFRSTHRHDRVNVFLRPCRPRTGPTRPGATPLTL